VAIAAMTFIVGMLVMPETKDVKMWDDAEGGS
jgi:hypothetical protein